VNDTNVDLSQVVTFTTADGVVLSARYWPPSKETDLTQPAYLVGHGFTGSGDRGSVRRICRRLTQLGRVVLAIDFRGHGRSQGRSTLGHAEVHDLAAGVAFLRDHGVRTLAVIGWSMGGSIALRYAGMGGDADAIVSISSPGYWFERGTSPMRLVHWAVETRIGHVATRMATRTRLGELWDEVPESPVEVVGRIAPTPLLIVHGEQDAFFPAPPRRSSRSGCSARRPVARGGHGSCRDFDLGGVDRPDRRLGAISCLAKRSRLTPARPIASEVRAVEGHVVQVPRPCRP
jgi:pimeloyl-ACP methyl ester carboxylesterase